MKRSLEVVLFTVTLLICIVGSIFIIDKVRPGLIDSLITRAGVTRGGESFIESVFYPGVNHPDLIIDDGYTHRSRQLEAPSLYGGPTDLLGFRNPAIPNRADVVIIGDSQTYGNNARMLESWPYVMRAKFQHLLPTIYSMAVGGWGALDYVLAFKTALEFKPKVIVVAFYTGNDPIESFKSAYGNDYWAEYRFDKSLSIRDAQPVQFPPADNDRWTVNVHDGQQTIMTPQYRGFNVLDDAVTDVSFQIMRHTAKQMATTAKALGIKLVFTVIPTKELVYANALSPNLELIDEYKMLVEREQVLIDQFSEFLDALPNSSYVDVLSKLQLAATERTALYPPDINGHPLAAGYAVIGKALVTTVEQQVIDNYVGPVYTDKGSYAGQLLFLQPNRLHQVEDILDLLRNGYGIDNVPLVQEKMLEGREVVQP